jgi:hypothetical protein
VASHTPPAANVTERVDLRGGEGIKKRFRRLSVNPYREKLHHRLIFTRRLEMRTLLEFVPNGRL